MSCGDSTELDLSADYAGLAGGCKNQTYHDNGCKTSVCERPKTCAPEEKKKCSSWGATYWISFILGFIIIAVIIALLLAAAKPNWVQNTDQDGQPDGSVNAGKVILWAVVVALFIILIIWIVLALAWGGL